MRYSPPIAGLTPAQPLLPCRLTAAALRHCFGETRVEQSRASKHRAALGRAMVLSAGEQKQHKHSGINANTLWLLGYMQVNLPWTEWVTNNGGVCTRMTFLTDKLYKTHSHTLLHVYESSENSVFLASHIISVVVAV